MYTSTMLGSPSKSNAHTPARMSRFDEHLPGPAHEVLEHVELAGGELDLVVAPPHPARAGVDAEVADRDRRRLARRARGAAAPGCGRRGPGTRTAW